MGWEARERLAWQEVIGPGSRWYLGCKGQSRVTSRWGGHQDTKQQRPWDWGRQVGVGYPTNMREEAQCSMGRSDGEGSWGYGPRGCVISKD